MSQQIIPSFQRKLYLTLVSNRQVYGVKESIEESEEFGRHAIQADPTIFRQTDEVNEMDRIEAETNTSHQEPLTNPISMRRFINLIVTGREDELRSSNEASTAISLFALFQLPVRNSDMVSEMLMKWESNLLKGLRFRTIECVIKVQADEGKMHVYLIIGLNGPEHLQIFQQEFGALGATNIRVEGIDSTKSLAMYRKMVPPDGKVNNLGPHLSDVNVLWFEFLIDRITKAKWTINRCLYENYSMTIKHMNELARVAKETESPQSDRVGVRVFVLIGPSRSGKSWFAKKFLGNASTYFCSADCTSYFQGYKNQRNIVIDEVERFGSRGYMTGKQLLLLTNDGHCRLNVKFSSVQIVATNIFFISNFELNEWFPNDNVTEVAFRNRIHWFGRARAQKEQPRWLEGPAMNEVRRHQTSDALRESPPYVEF